MIYFDTLVLGGGGMKCIATLGAVQYIYDNNDTEKIKKFVGTSAGAIISLLLAVQYTPIEIIVYICTQNVSESLLPADIFSLVKGNGAIMFEKVENHIRNMIYKKISRNSITLKELYDEYGKTLVCCTYNMTKNICEYVSKDTHPDLDCVTAVRMSSSIPIVFDDCVIDGDLYLDGGIVDNFPITIVDDKPTVFGCTIYTKYDSLDRNKLLGLIRIVTSISANFYIQRTINTYKNAKILTINLQNVDVLDFEQSSLSKLDLFSKGYNSCAEIFK